MFRHDTGTSSTHLLRFKRPIGAPVVIMAALLGFPAAGNASDCTIATHGEPAYERVKGKIQEKLKKIQQFQFEDYGKIDVSVSSGCVFELHGDFSFKKQRNLERRSFDASLTPKSGAPQGMKIEKLQISKR